MEALRVQTKMALAEALEVPPSSITDAIRRRAIPEAWLYKVAYRTRCRVEWLRTGEPPKHLEEGGAEGSHEYGRSLVERRVIEALEHLDTEEQTTVLRLLDALVRGDQQIRDHLINQLQIIEEAVASRRRKQARDTAARRPRQA